MVVEKNILVKELTEHARVHQGSQEAGVTVWGQEQVCFLLLLFFFYLDKIRFYPKFALILPVLISFKIPS